MTAVDIAQMPVSEKLQLMEALWDSLSAQSPENLGVPAWHGEVLEERLRRLASGAESVAPWNEAKKRIRVQVKAD